MNEPKTQWRHVKLGEVVKTINEVIDRSTLGEERYIAGEHIDEGDSRVRRWGLTTEAVFPPTFKRRFRLGDVLYHSRNLKKVATPQFAGITGEKLFVLRSADPRVLMPDLLPFLLQTGHFRAHVTRMWAGSTNKFLNQAPLLSYEFALPSLPEQRRIVDILRAFEDTRARLAQALHDGDLSRRSLLFEWFRPHRGSKDLLQQRWRISTIGKAGALQIGIRKHPGSIDGPCMRPYLRVANVLDGAIDWSEIMRINVPPAERERCALHDGDILINKGNSMNLVGRSAIFSQATGSQHYFQDHLVRFRSNLAPAPFALAYLQHLFYTLQFTKIAVASTSIATIPLDKLAALPFPIPPQDELLAMTGQIVSIERAISSLKDRLAASDSGIARILNVALAGGGT